MTCLLVVNYHYVSDRTYSHGGIYPIRPEALERQLRVLASRFAFVGLADVCGAVEGRCGLPERACLLTFDDGLLEQYECAWPILRRLGIPGAFFVNTRYVLSDSVAPVHKIHLLRAHVPPSALLARIRRELRSAGLTAAWEEADEARARGQYRYDDPEAARLKYLLNFVLAPECRDRVVDRLFVDTLGDPSHWTRRLYMTPGHWRELAAAGCLGTHGHSHVPMTSLSETDLRGEIRQSVALLERYTGTRPVAISYPYGGPTACSPSVAAASAAAGLRIGFTMERAFNRDLSEPLLLARADTNDVPGGRRPQFEVGASGIRITGDFGADRRAVRQAHVPV